MIIPKDIGTMADSKAHAIARSRIKRYITLLTIFSASSDRGDPDPCIDWDSFPFKSEYSELLEAGFITGSIGVPCKPGGASDGPAQISFLGITVSGVMKLAELSEYLWKSSLLGQVTLSLVQMGWLVVGVLIGAFGKYLFGV